MDQILCIFCIFFEGRHVYAAWLYIFKIEERRKYVGEISLLCRVGHMG